MDPQKGAGHGNVDKMAGCLVKGCDQPSHCRGWCRPHYRRWKRTGDPNFPARKMGVLGTPEDFWAKVDVRGPKECWPYRAISKANRGYGRAGYGGKQYVAHRLAYILAIGPVADGLVVDHLCHTDACALGTACPHRACCNPSHLEPKPTAKNTERGCRVNIGVHQREKTHCPHGHPYDAENTYRRPNGTRVCRACGRGRDRIRGRH